MINYVTFWDLFLAPIYIFIFYRIAVFISKKYYLNDVFLQKKIKQGFWVKIVAAILYVCLIQFYYGGGDAFMYFGNAQVMHRAIIDDVANIQFLGTDATPFYEYTLDLEGTDDEATPGYMISISNQLISKIACIFGFLCFKNYTVVSIMFSLLSFIGIWQIFLIFYKLFKTYKKEVALSFLFLPSFAFWGSGIIKEPVCLFGMGMMCLFVYNLIVKKQFAFLLLIQMLVGAYFLYSIKSYIFFILIFSIVILLIYQTLVKVNFIGKLLFLIVLFSIIATGSSVLMDSFLDDSTLSIANAEDLVNQANNVKNNYENTGGAFVDIGDIDPSLTGILKKTPAALLNVFFRPYLWEIKNVVMLFSMLESLLFLVLFIRALIKNKFFGFFSRIFNNPILLSCFVFSLTFGIFIGLTTFNFGTLVRYKLPCIPFFCILLLVLNTKKPTLA